MSVDARLQHLEYRMTGLEAVSFRRQGEHYELTINGARLVVGPKGDVTVHSPTQVSLVSSAGGVMRLERSMSLESYKPPVARYGGQKTKCNPPYKIDKATGVRSVKPECLYTRR